MIGIVKKFKYLILISFVFGVLGVFAPAGAKQSTRVIWDYFKEMALIMPPVFLLMGLMEVWVPKNKIQKWLGSGSGILGVAISIALGMLPTGPLYVAFPITASLLRKGASVTNMVIFLGAWAALKVPQIMVEIKFLGISFTILRFVLTLFALVIIGLIMEWILRKFPDKDWLKSENESNMN